MKIGDIIELKANKKTAYLQYVKRGDDKTQLEKIRVFYNLYDRPPNLIETIAKDDFFYLEFPLKNALKQKLVKIVGNVALPENFVFPRYFRTENIFGEGWSIMDSKGGQKNVIDLTEEQRKLSPYGMWNIPLIIDNLEKGWRLDNWINSEEE